MFSSQNKVVSKTKKKKRSSPNFGVIFRPKSEVQRLFPPKFKWSPKKKKKRSSPIFRVIFRPKSEIQRLFPPKIRWSPKKKRSSPKLRLIFRPISQIQTFEGGLFSIFHKKSASKALKTCDFAYFTSSSPPPRPPPWLCYCIRYSVFNVPYRLMIRWTFVRVVPVRTNSIVNKQ